MHNTIILWYCLLYLWTSYSLFSRKLRKTINNIFPYVFSKGNRMYNRPISKNDSLSKLPEASLRTFSQYFNSRYYDILVNSIIQCAISSNCDLYRFIRIRYVRYFSKCQHCYSSLKKCFILFIESNGFSSNRKYYWPFLSCYI